MDEHLLKVLAVTQKEISDKDREEVVSRLCKVVKKLYTVETDSKADIEKLKDENKKLKDHAKYLEERRKIEGQIIAILSNENEELKKELKSFQENRWRSIVKMTKELAISSCSSMIIYAYQAKDSSIPVHCVHGARLFSNLLPQKLQDMFTDQVDRLKSNLDSWLDLENFDIPNISLKDQTAYSAECGLVFQEWKPDQCPAQSNSWIDLD